MSDDIGLFAGQVWCYLSANGDASVTKISTDTGLGKNDVHRAIGWLAREGKLLVSTKGRTEVFTLI